MSRSEKKIRRQRLDEESCRFANTHLHVFLINPVSGKIEMFNKGDDEKRITYLIEDRGWEEIERID